MAYKSRIPDFAPPVQLHALSLSLGGQHSSHEQKRPDVGAAYEPRLLTREKRNRRNCMWGWFGSLYMQEPEPRATISEVHHVPQPLIKDRTTDSSFPDDQQQQQQVRSKQAQSRLLMLPLELRLMIYERVLCDGSRVQLNLEYNQAEGSKAWQLKYWHRVLSCPAFDNRGYLAHTFRDDTTRLLHYHSSNPDEVYNRHSDSKLSPRLSMNIARTCRQLNVEVAQVLFQKRTFTLQTDIVLRKLHDFLPRIYTDLMRSVELVWELTKLQQPHVSHSAKEEYDSLWECLGPKTLPALRHLRVIINPHHSALYQNGTRMDFTAAWLAPVVASATSRNLQSFEFAIPKSYCQRFRQDMLAARTFSLRRMRDELCYPTPAQREAMESEPESCPLSYQSFRPGEPMHDADCQGCDRWEDEGTVFQDSLATERLGI